MIKENAYEEGVLFAVPDDPSEHQGTTSKKFLVYMVVILEVI